MKQFETAMALEPTNAVYRYNYGLCFQDILKYESTLSQFNKAIELDPADPDFLILAGKCHTSLEDYDNARNCFLKAIEMDSKSAKYYAYYGTFLGETKQDINNAKSQFDKAIALEPGNAEIYYQCAVVLRDYKERYKESQEYYLKCLELSRNEPPYGSYGYLLYLMGEYESAMKYAQMELKSKQDKYVWGYFYLKLFATGNGE